MLISSSQRISHIYTQIHTHTHMHVHTHLMFISLVGQANKATSLSTSYFKKNNNCLDRAQKEINGDLNIEGITV